MKKYSLLVTAPSGMEKLSKVEIEEAGLKVLSEKKGTLVCEGNLEQAYYLCLWSRTANRVLLHLENFEVLDNEDLYKFARKFHWDDHFLLTNTIRIDIREYRSAINNTKFAAMKFKDGIVDQFRIRHDDRPSVAKWDADINLHIKIEGEQASLYLDLSGESLHKRGYRVIGGKAPLKENLAAAILLMSGLKDSGCEVFVDPMCGTGTLLVEALMILADIAPGIYRKRFGFESWKQHDPVMWEKIKNDAEVRREEGLKKAPLINGFDRDAKAISASWENIHNIGLSKHIHVERKELKNFEMQPQWEDKQGVLVTNPPYGERIGKHSELPDLYRLLGQKIKETCLNWIAAVFSGNPDYGKNMGLKAESFEKLNNGKIESRLLKFQITPDYFVETKHKDFQSFQERIEGHASDDAVSMFVNRVRKNLKKLKPWVRKENVECYRIYDKDLPEYAVAVDIYGDSVHVQEYAAPKTIDAQKAEKRVYDVLKVLPEILNVDLSKVFLKVRKQQKGTDQYEKQDQKKHFFWINENGLKFQVNLTDYLDTGLFLDHRPMRSLIREEAEGEKFLNLFAYTGSASVYAASGGARETTTVDMSKIYLNWAMENMKKNGFSGSSHQFVQADVLQWIYNAKDKYDLIFLDPPTFSNSKRMDQNFDVQRDHQELIKNTMKLLNKQGTLYFSNNFRSFKIDESLKNEFNIMNLTESSIPFDFARNARIHNAWKIQFKGE